jgi:hypothetical protein
VDNQRGYYKVSSSPRNLCDDDVTLRATIPDTASGGGKAPILRISYEPLSNGIRVDVFEFLSPKTFGTDSDRMSCGLPKPPISIGASGLPEHLREHPRLVSDGVVGQNAAGVAPEGIQSLPEPNGIIFMVKDYRVQVGGHDDVGIDAQPFMRVAESETLRQKTTGAFTHEHGQPGHDAVGNKVE